MIRFNFPYVVGREFAYMEQVVANRHLSGDGQFTRQCSQLLESLLNVPKVLLTTSCTHALEMAALLLDLQPGDEVIVPSFTFVSTANAFALYGAKPVFADIRPDTLNIDERLLPSLITERTRAISCVHYAGVGCEMDAIMTLAEQHNLKVIEDNAHGLFGSYRGQALGTFGFCATQSFHETKNIQCGEGGALLVNDVDYVERAEIIREKGTNRSRFFRGQVDKYTWVDIGSSYLMSELLAAFLYAQLEVWEDIQTRRARVWQHYHANLQGWAAENGVQLPTVPEYCEQAYHMYYMLLPDEQARQALIAHLKAHDILSVFHYQALNASPMGLQFGGLVGGCPVTERVSDQLLRLPFYNSLSQGEQDYIIEKIMEFKVS